jgi:DNA-binding CsgD family transcriptional regulator
VQPPRPSSTSLLIGRERELEHLRTLLGAAREGGPGALVIHGEPGSGKTTLLRSILAESDGFTVLRAEGVESESDLPYSGLAELLAPLQELRHRIPAPQRQALERALALSEGGVRDRFAVGAATVSLLGAAAAQAPVLCTIDDAQCIDLASLEAIRFAARRLAGMGVVVIFVTRGDEEPAIDAAGLETLKIGPLAMPSAREIVFRAAKGRLDGPLVDRIIATAGGNPLALVEMTESLASDRLGAAVEPLPPGGSAQELFAERIATLSDRTALALVVMAAAGDERAEIVGGALAHLGLEMADLEPAEELRLVEIENGRLAFRHPLVRSATYHRAAPPTRRRAHAAVAVVLPPGDPRLPWHRAAAAAAPDEDIASAMEETARAARRRGGYFAAARAHQHAADLSPDPERRARRLLAAAEDTQLLGRTEQALDMVAEAARLTEAPAIHSLSRGLRADLELRQGRPPLAREILRDEAGRAGTDTVQAGLLMMKSAFAAMLAGDVGGWRADAERAHALLTEAGAPLARLARAFCGVASVAGGDQRGPDELSAGSIEPTVLPDLLRNEEAPVAGTVEIYTLVAQAWIWLEEWERASALLDALVVTLRELAAITALVYPLSARAGLDYRLGRWDTALAGVSEAMDLALETNQSAALTGALGIRAVIRGSRGDTDGCRDDAGRGLELSEQIGAPLTATWAHQGLGRLALANGDMEEAIEQLSLARDGCGRAGIVEPGALNFVPDLAEALVRSGRASEAMEAIQDYEARAEASGRRVASATATRLRGLLAADDAFDELFRQALALHEGLPAPYELARTLLVYGERLRRARRLTESREPLRTALRLFEQLGAEAWARRARTELRATGASLPSETPALFAALTAHEVQVAQLVAEGRTNREIAAALFIAPKTVEHHLSRVFRKLGIRRRAELAALAGELRPGYRGR